MSPPNTSNHENTPSTGNYAKKSKVRSQTGILGSLAEGGAFLWSYLVYWGYSFKKLFPIYNQTLNSGLVMDMEDALVEDFFDPPPLPTPWVKTNYEKSPNNTVKI